MQKSEIEDIERAAWYARLALGVFTDADQTLPQVPDKSDSTFSVMP